MRMGSQAGIQDMGVTDRRLSQNSEMPQKCSKRDPATPIANKAGPPCPQPDHCLQQGSPEVM